MGLDQWIFRKLRADEEGVQDEELAYWRKANMVREWFVNHTGYPVDADCKKHFICRGDLVFLLADCKAVLEDHELAEELLPTSSGFFFGDTDYNEYYYDDLRYTVEVIEEILQRADLDTNSIYYYEWW